MNQRADGTIAATSSGGDSTANQTKAGLTLPLPRTSIRLVNADSGEIALRLKSVLEHGAERPYLVFALHVGGLNLLTNPRYVTALEHGDLIYADGISVVLVGRALGGHRIERCPTTDLVPSVLALASAEQPIRMGLIGGPPGLAALAGRILVRSAASAGTVLDVVYATDGFKSDSAWSVALAELSSKRPDIVLVGLGAPTEAIWSATNINSLPPCIVITCGGLFGHLVGLERRAPAIVQRLGLEWTWRLAQRPQLLSRYLLGALTTMRLLWVSLALRRR